MPADWPDTLPQRLFVNGSQEGAADGRLRSKTDTGPGKSRPRSSAMPRPLAGTMRMNGAQLDILLDADAARLMARHGPRLAISHRTPVLELSVDRRAAVFSAWYELFPRSASDDPQRHGTFEDVIAG